MAVIPVAPGGNLTTAYNSAAASGDILQLSPGSYGAWTTPVGTKVVTIQGAGDATTFTLITCNLANATFKDLRARCISDPSQFGGAPTASWHDCTFDNVTVDGEHRTNVYTGNGAGAGATIAEYVVLLHCSSLNARNTFRDCRFKRIKNGKLVQFPGNGHVFDNCFWDDMLLSNTGRVPGDEVHLEGMFVLASPNLVVKNSTFTRCQVMNIFFSASSDAADARTKNVTLENNVFGHCLDESNGWHNGPSVYVVHTESYNKPAEENPDGTFGPIDNFIIRNNLFEHGLALGGLTSAPDRPVINGSKIVGNIGGWDDLTSDGMTYRDNVGTSIHATDFSVSPSSSTPSTPIPVGWVSPSTNDFHLTVGSVARGKGSPTDHPVFDKDGVARAATPDAGPYEYAAAGVVPVDAFQARILGDLDDFIDWKNAEGVEAVVGEFGWPGDNPDEYWPGDPPLWNGLAEAYYDTMQADDVWSLQWGTSESFAAYELAPYTGPSGVLTTARPQSIPLENHLADAGVRRGVALTGLEFGDWAPNFSNQTPGAIGTFGQVANSQASWNYLFARGIRIARVGFRWERLQPTLGGALNAPYLAQIQTQVTRAATAGIDVVLDLHNFGEYYSGPPGGVQVLRLGSAGLTQAHFVDVWSRLSAAFAAAPTVVGYGLMNEPHDVVGGDAAWETMSQAAFNAVRANDATTEVYVCGHNWSKLQTWAARHPDKWIVGTGARYEPHHYWDTESSEMAGSPSLSQKEDSVYVQTYDEGVADSSPTVYVRNPRPAESVSVSPITVKGVRDTAGSTTVTVKVYPAGSGTAVHTQAVVTSSREWSLLLNADLPVGDLEVTATQGAVVSPRRAFEQLSLEVDAFGMSRGPTGSHWGPDADLGTGEWTRSEDPRGTYVDDAFAVAADFDDASSGINHHFPYMTSAQIPIAIQRMQEMGIRHIRMGLSSPAIDSRTDYNLKTAQACQQIRTANANRAAGIQNISILAGASGPPAYKQDADNDNPRAFWTCTTTNGNYLYPLDLPLGFVDWANVAGQPAGNPGANNPSGGWSGTYHRIGWTDMAAFQGPNEPPNFMAGYASPGSMRDEYRMLRDAKNARTAKTVLGGVEYIDYRTGRIATGPAFAPQMAVFGFGGLQSGAASYNLFGDYTDGNDQDFGASHEYWGGHLPGFSQQWGKWGVNGGDHFSQKTSYNGAAPGGPGRWAKTLPLVCTETGYYTTEGAGTGAGQNCAQDVAAEYLIRTMINHYLGGFKRTYWFMLSDEASNQPQMGCTDAAFNPKATYWAMRNLHQIVGFREPSVVTPITLPTTGFVPGPTNKIIGQPQYDTQFPDELHKLILQTEDDAPVTGGREYIAPYSRQRTIWQRVQGVRVNVGDPQVVTIQLPAGQWSVSVAEPAKNPIQSPVDGITYPNPTNGSLFSSVGVSTGSFRDRLVPDLNNQIELVVAGLTRFLKLTELTAAVVPIVAVTAPASSSTTTDPTPPITGTAGNAVGDNANVVVTVYSGVTASGSPVTGPTNVPRSGTAWSYTAPTLADGTYTVRVTQAGSAGTSAPADRTFSVLVDVPEPPPIPLPPPIRPMVRERPRTDLHGLATTPSGRKYRWSDSGRDGALVLSDLSFSTSMPGGYNELSGSFARKPNVPAPDMMRLTDIDIRSPGGSQAWEGRLERAPKTSGDVMSISPSAVGYQAELEDDKGARFLGVDRNFGNWGPMSTQRWLDLNETATLPGPFRIFDAEQAADEDHNLRGLALSLTPPWGPGNSGDPDNPRTPVVEGWYDAKGLDIGALFYSWNKYLISAADPEWFYGAYLSPDAVASAIDATGNLLAAGPGNGVLLASQAGRKFALLQLFQTGSTYPALSILTFTVWFTGLVTLGTHGMTVRTNGTLPTGQVGLYASDIVRHVVPRFAPRLKVTNDSVEASNFLIEQFSYFEPTTAAQMVKDAARFELQDWAVWGNKTFYFNRRGSRGKHYKARIRPTQLAQTGPAMDRLWESIIVRYTDPSGEQRTVGPPGSGADTESPLLKDPDPGNPANQLGKIRRDVLEMGSAGSPLEPIEIGYRFLQETKLLDGSGQARLVGHIKDDHGVRYPASRVRAGDTISFVDASDKSARRIVATSYDHNTRTNTVDLDAPPGGLQALLERFSVRLAPYGFG